MDATLAARLEDFHKKATAAGEEVVFKDFPAKIYCGYQTSHKISPYHPNHAYTFTDTTVYPPPQAESTGSKKRKLDDSMSATSDASDTQSARYPQLVRANTHLPQLHTILKRECEELIVLTDKIKLWISLTMPNFPMGDFTHAVSAVTISEFKFRKVRSGTPLDLIHPLTHATEVVGELARSQDSAINLRDSARNDYLARAKICSKLIKYPHVEDYALALKEHDDTQFYLTRQHLSDLRNLYAVLTDLIHKNIAKIKSPKGNGGFGLY
ncbi:PA28-beta domain-containing protein [Mycena indigotica]|uniref:PA28-beta domain-containing protein n=1 Tax=Mycena indigotica TaxID=2126181 RepID=A0A8H6SXU4_9AGAR|nr:PA28-beta domain-containing protein [Mycena indigotica]KAF7307125.1 PA28-beta domain-containing protein [Mycena indigotica]